MIGGTAVAGGIGYYLYRAGGNPKVAEREAERKTHFHTCSRSRSLHVFIGDVTKLRGGAAGTKDEAKAEFKLHAEEVGQKLDSAVSEPTALAAASEFVRRC